MVELFGVRFGHMDCCSRLFLLSSIPFTATMILRLATANIVVQLNFFRKFFMIAAPDAPAAPGSI